MFVPKIFYKYLFNTVVQLYSERGMENFRPKLHLMVEYENNMRIFHVHVLKVFLSDLCKILQLDFV